MIVRHKKDLIGTTQQAMGPVWESNRLFIKRDGLGFSFHETIVRGGTEQVLWYKNHIEGVIITRGKAEIVDLATGETHQLEEGSGYALTYDKHIFRALTEVVCICVFLPGLNGDEIPDGDGSYPAD